ncbi:hypothetical protein FIBSPDRAFT_739667 [Athelia psychrophila]|uniref:peptidylprolyl isomerase n=1 Tax=Athelia psychrophila TaxID=1759441 RepID=A0A166KM74_9AGAM|nr:hypothetical protein FIBSPDRAFT_739667 [Fibularhizoctonia sp. CBS 109695]
MHLFKYTLSVLALAVGALAESESATAKVGIEVTYMPSECVEKTQMGDFIKVHYTGTLADGGKKFDSRFPCSIRDCPATDPSSVGAGRVIKGWEEGLQGMCLHEKRTLTIPPELGYGKRGSGSIIPGDSTLLFDVELMDIDITKRPEVSSRPGDEL